jgi:hypothetical protein
MHNSKPAPRTSRKGSQPQPVTAHAGTRSVGTHGSNRKISAARMQADAYYARKKNRAGRPPLD